MFVHVLWPQVEFLMEWFVLSALPKILLTLAVDGEVALGWSVRLPVSPVAKYLPMSDSVSARGVQSVVGTLAIWVWRFED